MALLENQDVPLGTPCPDFALPTVAGETYALADAADAPVLCVLFLCNHCPYVQAVEDRIIALAHEYGPRGVQFVAICSNDPTDYPDDAPARLLARWREKDYRFPYLIDAAQHVARAFAAVCTPDIYVYDRERRLAYHGRLDDDWKNPARVTRRDLAAAFDALLGGRRPATDQPQSIGCSIKWTKTSS
jgi:peroxiredoxin